MIEFKRSINMKNMMPVIVSIIIILVFQLINPEFLSGQGLITLVYSMSYFLIAACGLTMVIMMGSFDFSVVSVMKLAALISVMNVNRMGLMVIPFTLAVCLFIGFVNGFIFTKLKVPSFMATLGISVVIDGIALLASKGFLLMVDNDQFRKISVTFIGGLPSIFYWSIGIWVVCTLLSLITSFGRKTYAIGGNARAAAVSGINVDRHRIFVFMLSSMLAGLAGILYIAQLGGGSVKLGSNMMIPLFASVVAGGTSLKGGVGGPHKTVIGVIIITWMQSGLLMIGLGRDIQVTVLGIIAIIMSLATSDHDKNSRTIVK